MPSAFAATAADTALPTRWRWLALGLALAWAGQFVLPCMFAWFLSAIPHEMGHATVGCLLGRPSAPAISLAGHAWSATGELRPWLVWVVAAAFGIGAYAQRPKLGSCIVLALAAAAVPLVAFRPLAEVLITAGGHLGELAFAGYCFHLAWTGGRTDTPQERTACAMAGGILQATNMRLFLGLMTDHAARAEYAGNGSLGLKNDLLVLAEDQLHCGLPRVAFPMFALALLPLPIGVATALWRHRSAKP